MWCFCYSGVAALSCTDCSGSSTASSDIAEPGSPFSSASSNSEDSQQQSQSQSSGMAPNAHQLQPPPWPRWSDHGQAGTTRRPRPQAKITEFFKTQGKSAATTPTKHKTAANGVKHPQEVSLPATAPSVVKANATEGRKYLVLNGLNGLRTVKGVLLDKKARQAFGARIDGLFKLQKMSNAGLKLNSTMVPIVKLNGLPASVETAAPTVPIAKPKTCTVSVVDCLKV